GVHRVAMRTWIVGDLHERVIVVGSWHDAVLEHEDRDAARIQPARDFGAFLIDHQEVEGTARTNDNASAVGDRSVGSKHSDSRLAHVTNQPAIFPRWSFELRTDIAPEVRIGNLVGPHSKRFGLRRCLAHVSSLDGSLSQFDVSRRSKSMTLSRNCWHYPRRRVCNCLLSVLKSVERSSESNSARVLYRD